jgi:hypothetical protein
MAEWMKLEDATKELAHSLQRMRQGVQFSAGIGMYGIFGADSTPIIVQDRQMAARYENDLFFIEGHNGEQQFLDVKLFKPTAHYVAVPCRTAEGKPAELRLLPYLSVDFGAIPTPNHLFER